MLLRRVTYFSEYTDKAFVREQFIERSLESIIKTISIKSFIITKMRKIKFDAFSDLEYIELSIITYKNDPTTIEDYIVAGQNEKEKQQLRNLMEEVNSALDTSKDSIIFYLDKVYKVKVQKV